MSYRYGTLCDQLVGVRYLSAAGELISVDGEELADGGGRASALNPARLLYGSQGGLGVLVSASFRVQPLPAGRIWVCRPVWTPLEVHDLVGAVLAARFGPAAIELDLPAHTRPVPRRPLRSAAPSGSSGTLAVLLEGGPADVTERAGRLVELLGVGATVGHRAPDWWRRYPFRSDDTALRVEVPITDLHAAVYALRDAAGGPVPVRGSAGLGVVYAALPGAMLPDRVASILAAVRQVLLARQGRCVVVSAPPSVRHAVDFWGELPAAPRLRAAKDHLDPHRRLAPGRLPGGL